MKLTNKLHLLIAAILIGLSLFGVFEERAFKFVNSVYQKNLDFLALTTEIKLVLSGIGSIKIPFVDGISTNINETITEVQRFLLITNIISFIQVMIIAVSKSWIIKSITIILFILSIPKKTKIICSKLLVFSLALNPGLTMYSSAVQEISKEASIDYGDKYLKKLKVSVEAVKSEKAELMKQHAADITNINNGQKKGHFLRKFTENVAYDFKKIKTDIKGAHANIRLLLHKGGHEMTSKIFGFCSMILFSMVLLPVGYLLLIYTLFKSLFKNNHLVELIENSSGTLIRTTTNHQRATKKNTN